MQLQSCPVATSRRLESIQFTVELGGDRRQAIRILVFNMDLSHEKCKGKEIFLIRPGFHFHVFVDEN